MKIGWFTPYNPRSGIGDYSEVIVNRLAAVGEVVVFTSEPEGGPVPRPAKLPLVRLPRHCDRAFLAGLEAFDVLVYNMGNHAPYHQAIFEVAVQRPGIVILHDVVLRDFFLGYYFLCRRDPEEYVRMLAYSHGPEGEQLGRDLLSGLHEERLDDPARLQMPLFRPALHRCQGVIVHSDEALRRVRAACPAPAARLDFPIFGPVEVFARQAPPARRVDGKVRLLTFGVLNPNKLVHATLAALAASPFLRERVTFTAIGEAPEPYRNALWALIREAGLDGVVKLPGYCSDEVLRSALLEADVVVNLRNPHLGESSASLLNSLVAGVPTVVWNHGSYSEFPNDVVCKVASEAELRPALEGLVRDEVARRQMGDRARAHALERFDIDRYCQGFQEFLAEVRSQRPLLALADRVSDFLLEMGSGALDGLTERVAEEMAGLQGIAPDAILPLAPLPPVARRGRATRKTALQVA